MSVFKVVILETYVREPSKMYYSKLFNKKMRKCKKWEYSLTAIRWAAHGWHIRVVMVFYDEIDESRYYNR